MRYPVTLLLALVIFATPAAHAQVSVHPTGSFLTSEKPYESVTITNNSSQTQEVEVEFEFGYPASDEDGNVGIVRTDHEREEKYALGPHLAAFPSRSVLAPGEQQTVRMVVENTSLDDGIYWTRLITAVTPQSSSVEGAHVNLRLRQSTLVAFKNGPVRQQADFDIESDFNASSGAAVLLHFSNEEGVPFWGTYSYRLTDEAGNVVDEGDRRVAVYFGLTRRLQFEGLEEDSYTFEATLTPRRQDVPASFRPQQEPITKSITLGIR